MVVKVLLANHMRSQTMHWLQPPIILLLMIVCEAQINLLEIHIVRGVDNLLCRMLSANRAECLAEAKECVGQYIVSLVLFTGILFCLVPVCVCGFGVCACVYVCIDF